jgi:hypothetical protein
VPRYVQYCRANVPYKGQTNEDTPIAGIMTPRGPPHGRRQAGGEPPGLQQSRMKTRTREAHNSSSEVEPKITEISARISSWLHSDNVGTLAHSRPGLHRQFNTRSSGNSDPQRPASASKGTARWGRRGQIPCQQNWKYARRGIFMRSVCELLKRNMCPAHPYQTA